MDQAKWKRWVLQTATIWEDIEGFVHNTGIEQLDHDHRRLLEYIFAMETIAKKTEESNYDLKQLEKQKLVFQRFLALMFRHCEREISYINHYNLPGKKIQDKQHESIQKKFKHIFKDFEEGILSTFQEMKIDFLEELLHHINKSDVPTFGLHNFIPTLKKARTWEDVSEIIKTTGVPFVDDEHQKLTRHILKLKTFLADASFAIETKIQRETVIAMVDELYRFTVEHFDHEVEFLNKYHLSPEKQEGQHEIFLGIVSKKKADLAAGNFQKLGEFIDYLVNWWVTHINGIDYVEFHFSRIAEPVFDQSTGADDFGWLIRKTGVEEIDREHVHLIGLLLEMSKIDVRTVDADVIKDQLNAILEYAASHFNDEEEIMKSRNYAGIGTHQDVHVSLLESIEEVISMATSGHSRISPMLLKRIMGWWVQHTNGMDYETFVLNETVK